MNTLGQNLLAAAMASKGLKVHAPILTALNLFLLEEFGDEVVPVPSKTTAVEEPKKKAEPTQTAKTKAEPKKKAEQTQTAKTKAEPKKKVRPLAELLKEMPDGDVQIVSMPMALMAHVPAAEREVLLTGLDPTEWVDEHAFEDALLEGADKELINDIIRLKDMKPYVKGTPLILEGGSETDQKMAKVDARIQEVLTLPVYEGLVEAISSERGVPDGPMFRALGAIARAVK